MLKTIRNLLIIVMIFGVVSAAIDYYRLTIGEKPVFCISSYDYNSKIETSRGIFYIVDRKINHSTSERLEMSKSIKFRFLTQKLKISIPHPKITSDYVLFVKKSLDCPLPSRLYVELKDKKVYIDCIDSIEYKDKKDKKYKSLDEVLKDKPKLIDDIINKLTLVGVGSDRSTEKYEALDDTFVNQHLYVYRCNNVVKDVYITMNPKQEKNYCTIK